MEDISMLDIIQHIHLYQSIPIFTTASTKRVDTVEMAKRVIAEPLTLDTELAKFVMHYKSIMTVSASLLFPKMVFSFEPVLRDIKDLFETHSKPIPIIGIEHVDTYIFSFPPFSLGVYKSFINGISDISIYDDPDIYLAINIHPDVFNFKTVMGTIVHEYLHHQLQHCSKIYCQPFNEAVVRKFENEFVKRINPEKYIPFLETMVSSFNYFKDYNNRLQNAYAQYQSNLRSIFNDLQKTYVSTAPASLTIQLCLHKHNRRGL